MSQDDANRRAQILAASARRQQQAGAPAPAAPTGPIPAPPKQAFASTSNKEFQVSIVPPGTPKERLRNPQNVTPGTTPGVITVGQGRQNTRGARNVQPVAGGGRGGNVQPVSGPPNATVRQIQKVQTQSRTGVQAQMSVPTPGQQPARPAPRLVPQAAPPVDATLVLSYHNRPQLAEQHLRYVFAQSVAPAALMAWINPGDAALPATVTTALENAFTIHPKYDMGPWMRWAVASQAYTEYVIVLDDDCMPGPKWIERAIERLSRGDQHDVVSAAGEVFSADAWDAIRLVGPQAPPSQEVQADVGTGGWVMRTETARIIAATPRASEMLSTGMHIAACVQAHNGSIIVLSYDHDRAGWGMLEPQRSEGSMSQIANSDPEGPNASELRDAIYGEYRAGGWMPLCVAIADSASDVETARIPMEEIG